MTADEIRADYKGEQPCFDPMDEGSVAVAMIQVLAEIAAQLAEHNDLTRKLFGGSDDQPSAKPSIPDAAEG